MTSPPRESPYTAAVTGVIGAGRLGTTLACALDRAAIRVSCVASVRAESARLLAERLQRASALDAEAVCARADVVWLAVPDDALHALAASLPFRSGQAVVYCSGALGLDVLQRARDAGAAVGCFHPLQTFPQRFDAPSRFASITCGIEASDAALHARLEQVCRALGASGVSLAGVDRAAYHAAAVLSSNYVIALHAAAAQAWQLAGLPAEQARAALVPLTLGAAHAIERLPLHDALTGPLARADLGTLRRHVAALARSPELLELYRTLARKLLDLPIEWSAEQRAQLAELFLADRS